MAQGSFAGNGCIFPKRAEPYTKIVEALPQIRGEAVQLVRQAVGALPARYPTLSSVLIFSGNKDVSHTISKRTSDIFESKPGDAGSGYRNCHIRIRAPINEFPLDQLI
jgi:hypothetical protein